MIQKIALSTKKQTEKLKIPHRISGDNDLLNHTPQQKWHRKGESLKSTLEQVHHKQYSMAGSPTPGLQRQLWRLDCPMQKAMTMTMITR